ncbi:hypothetical protein TVAG_443760 [Trichomonas vaginalis G3]|uniref:Uncharacterized protein n=1 Tax=Trichomonas vaginalis (strain ATCC PRA-98 / G3) TaxID=412133 RepID=A2EU00_TRIV3|nr:hypothetical protein TVAGG3_0235110 [Trichomonas vaginalis G3]EAY03888.1 hypothetical protein TVAG_443760 [Trichomonas vaginalis G3]KAI5552934.1 hypothetical protein TVAGG3_0235110 [Trichomonas vaginalis G3]|eukprot:XP_001316111.1 hypothetical protein [Trichomonas vaginalis G3]
MLNKIIPKKQNITADSIKDGVITKEITIDVDVQWRNACELLEYLIQPIKFQDIFAKNIGSIDFHVNIHDFAQLYYLASTINFEILRYNLDIQLYQLNFEQALIILSVVEKFYIKNIRLSKLRIPLIEFISDCMQKEFNKNDWTTATKILCSTPEITQIINSPIFSQPITRFLQKSRNNAFVLDWLVNVFGAYIQSEDKFKFEFYDLCMTIKEDKKMMTSRYRNAARNIDESDELSDIKNFVIWCYSQYNDLIVPNDEEIVISKQEMLQFLDAPRLFILFIKIDINQCESSIAPYATLAICCDADMNARERIFHQLCSNNFIDLSKLEFRQILEILRFAMKEIKTNPTDIFIHCFTIAAEQIKSYDNYLDLILASDFSKYIPEFGFDQLKEVFKTPDPKYSQILFTWMLNNRNNLSQEIIQEFINAIDNSENSFGYKLFAIDVINSIGTQNQEQFELLKNSFDVKTILLALKSFEKLNISINDRKTIHLVHNITVKDYLAHAKFLSFLDKFKISIRKSEIVLPLTELTLATALNILKRIPVKHISQIVIENLIPLVFLIIDELNTEDLELFCLLIAQKYKHIVQSANIKVYNEQQIALLSNRLNLPEILCASRLPFSLFALSSKMSIVFQFQTEMFLTFIENEKWTKFEPSRTELIPNARTLIPLSICVVVFDEENQKSADEIKIKLEYAGFKKIMIVFIKDEEKEIPEASSYVMWLPKEKSDQIDREIHSKVYEKLKGRPLSVSATLIREFSDIYLPKQIIHFEDQMRRIDWEKVSDKLCPNKEDLFILPMFSDNVFQSIPFIIPNKENISEEISMKCQRELAVCFVNSTLSIFNFELVLDESLGPLYYAASKISINILAALLCESSANQEIQIL